MSLTKQFLETQWDAREATLGSHAGYRYAMTTPSFVAECVAMIVDDAQLFHLTARDSFSEELAAQVLDRCVSIDSTELLQPKVKVLAASASPVGGGFDSVVIAPPQVELFAHWPEELQSKVYLAAPAYRSEFKDGSSARDFRHQIGRKDGWRVHVYDWNRAEKTEPKW